MPFYKQLLGKPITLDDLESVDPDLHRSLVWILYVANIVNNLNCFNCNLAVMVDDRNKCLID